MKRKLLGLFLAVSLFSILFTALHITAAAASNGTCGENLTWTLDDEGTLTISGTGKMKTSFSDIPWKSSKSSIKSVIVNNGVTSIGEYAFIECINLADITIPNSVTSIGDCAFRECGVLTNVTISDNVTSIGSNAFIACSSLTSIDVSSSNNNYTSEDGVLFNKNKTKLICCPGGKTQITIPDSVISIYDFAFSGCCNLAEIKVSFINLNYSSENGVLFNKDKTKLIWYPRNKKGSYTIPDSITSIDEETFSECTGLTGITIPNSITSIPPFAFSFCSNLRYINFPDSLTSIGNCAFTFCSSLTSIDLPKSLTTIDTYAFGHCSSLKSITIPDSVTSLGYNAFDNCTSLTTAIIGNGITIIECGVFEGCSSLKSITIGSNVTEIDFPFEDCKNLTDIYIHDLKAYLNIKCDYMPFIGMNACNLYLNNKLLTKVVIPDGVTKINDYVFFQNANITNVVIPDSVIEIGECAFSYCSNLTRIALGNNVTSIGGCAFDCCSNLKDIILPDTLTNIDSFAFAYCSSLKSITIPSSVANIGMGAFEFCDSLTDVYYSGSEAEWAKISIDNYNEDLTKATIHYNYKINNDNDNGFHENIYRFDYLQLSGVEKTMSEEYFNFDTPSRTIIETGKKKRFNHHD